MLSPRVLSGRARVCKRLSHSCCLSEAPCHSPALPLQTVPASSNREPWHSARRGKQIGVFRQPVGLGRVACLKSTCCSPREPEFFSQHPHRVAYNCPLATPAIGDLTPASVLCTHVHMPTHPCTQTCSCAHAHTPMCIHLHNHVHMPTQPHTHAHNKNILKKTKIISTAFLKGRSR